MNTSVPINTEMTQNDTILLLGFLIFPPKFNLEVGETPLDNLKIVLLEETFKMKEIDYMVLELIDIK